MEQKTEKLQNIRVAGDPVLIRVIEENRALNMLNEKKLQILLIKRDGKESRTFSGYYSLPGCAAVYGENLEESVLRRLEEKTSISREKIKVKKFNVFYEPDRDPRNHVIGVAFYSIIEQDTEFNLSENAVWADLDEIANDKLEMAFDHKKVVLSAVNKIKTMLRQTPIALMFLNEKFTLGELHGIFSALREKIAQPNLLRDFLKAGYIIKTDEKEEKVYKRNKGHYYIKSEKAKKEIEEINRSDSF